MVSGDAFVFGVRLGLEMYVTMSAGSQLETVDSAVALHAVESMMGAGIDV
ncbi:MAG: hypothetical protein KDA93_22065 [Planctomycetaceae bacterium]|nr:hypothetical protein [Planctomycetaceae bacterium]